MQIASSPTEASGTPNVRTGCADPRPDIGLIAGYATSPADVPAGALAGHPATSCGPAGPLRRPVMGTPERRDRDTLTGRPDRPCAAVTWPTTFAYAGRRVDWGR